LMTFDTPVLLIAWRRPHTLRQVIDAIRPVAPSRLYVACDGPNPERPGEAEKVSATRAVIEHEIDWPCQIERLYSDVNQGCRLGVSRAITWFFEQVEEGVILEDDCVPHSEFLPYCANLLEHYRNDTRIWCITGDNAASIKLASSHFSYGFIRYPLIWGWATWGDRWKEYLFDFDHLSDISKNNSYMLEVFNSNKELARAKTTYWMDIKSGKGPNTWDAAWAFTCMVNSGLTILPSVNLVSNIGFGVDATHTLGNGGSRDNAQTKKILPISHPPYVIRDAIAEKHFEEAIYGSRAKKSNFLEKCRTWASKISIKLAKAIFPKIYNLPN
jgi:hypothetical protein